jgi:hypothetical protein
MDIKKVHILRTLSLSRGKMVRLEEHDAGGIAADLVWHCMAEPPCNWKKAWNGTAYPEQRESIRTQMLTDWMEHVSQDHERTA